jgi:hypothetical protein
MAGGGYPYIRAMVASSLIPHATAFDPFFQTLKALASEAESPSSLVTSSSPLSVEAQFPISALASSKMHSADVKFPSSLSGLVQAPPSIETVPSSNSEASEAAPVLPRQGKQREGPAPKKP